METPLNGEKYASERSWVYVASVPASLGWEIRECSLVHKDQVRMNQKNVFFFN